MTIEQRIEILESKFGLQGQIWTDPYTNLMWCQNGSTDQMTWHQAHEYVERLNEKNHLGYNDWRLPTIEELSSLINYDKIDPACKTLLNCHSSYYWSATTYAPGTGRAWYVDFDDGFVGNFNQGDTNYVRCCRNA